MGRRASRERSVDADHATIYRWVQHTAPELEIGTSWYQNRLSLQKIGGNTAIDVLPGGLGERRETEMASNVENGDGARDVGRRDVLAGGVAGAGFGAVLLARRATAQTSETAAGD